MNTDIKAIDDKLNFEFEHQGQVYVIPLEIREVLIDNKKKQMWCMPFKHYSGFPVHRAKLTQIRSSIKGIFNNDKFRQQLHDLVKEGIIVIKNTK